MIIFIINIYNKLKNINQKKPIKLDHLINCFSALLKAFVY